MTTSVSLPRPRFLWLPALVTLAAACATGSVNGDDSPLLVTSDAGTTTPADDASPPTTTTPSTPTPSDDAAPPSTGDDDASPPPTGDDDASPPSDPVDAAPPPVVIDAAPPPVVVDAAPPPPTSSCPGYADPTTTAACNSGCTTHTCTANGCYNGYYCELSVTKCVAKPSSCP